MNKNPDRDNKFNSLLRIKNKPRAKRGDIKQHPNSTPAYIAMNRKEIDVSRLGIPSPPRNRS